MSPLALFAGPYGVLAKWGVIALLAAAFGGWCWVQGNEHGTAKLVEYQGKQLVEAGRIRAAREVVTERVVTHYVKVKGETQVVTDTIVQEVVKYAEKNPAGVCLDDDWRRVHDNAAANRLPDAAPRPPGGLRTPTGPAQGLRSAHGVTGVADGDRELHAASSLR